MQQKPSWLRAGYSLIEVLITSGVLMVVLAGFSQILDLNVKNQQNIAYADRKQDILLSTVNLINNDIAWQQTIDFAANTNLDCLKDKAKFPAIASAGNCLATDGGRFSLLNEAGAVYLDNANPAAGFSLRSGPCNTHSLAGDDLCPLRGEVSWRPLCVGCANGQVEITINLFDRPLNRSTTQAPVITRRLIRYAHRYDSDLVLHLSLDGAVGSTVPLGGVINDVSSYRNNGVISEWAAGGTLPTYFAGKVGQGLSFDSGVDKWKWITIPDSLSLRPGILTVSAWVKWTSVAISPRWSGIVDKFLATEGDSYVLRVRTDQNFAFCVAEYIGNQCIDSDSNPINTNVWYHVVGTWDGALMKMYVNGVLQAETKAVTTANKWNNSPLIIGAESQLGLGNTNPYQVSFPGVIDEVKIWRRVLSAPEVLNEFNNP